MVARPVSSALGGGARYWCSGFAADRFGETLIVNVLGSFVIGFFATLTSPDGRLLVRTEARQFVMVGLCGGRLHHLLVLQPADPRSDPGQRDGAGGSEHRAFVSLVPARGLARSFALHSMAART